jgi:hypothetical protein
MSIRMARPGGGALAATVALALMLSPFLSQAAGRSGSDVVAASGRGETTDEGWRVRLRVDGLALFLRGPSAGSGSTTAFSPFLTFDLAASSKIGITLGLSPPVVKGQAFATHISMYVLFGRGPAFLEAGIGSYYQNTWCNAAPNRRAYTAYLGLCDRKLKGVDLRVGVHAGRTSGGAFAWGAGFGIGRGPR